MLMSKTIVMIHGMFCSGEGWRNYADHFTAAGYTCLKPTLRFHDMDPQDKPDPRLGTTSLLDYMEELDHIIGTLYEPPVIMGHSMGGLLAQMLAAQGLGSALVLLNPAPPAGIWAILNGNARRAFRRYRWKWGFWRKPFRITFKEASAAAFNLLPPDRHREAYDTLVYESGRAAFEIGTWFLDKGGTTRVDSSKVTCPTLIIGGAQDRITPAVITRKVAGKYRHVATYKEFSEHAHWVIGEPGWEDVANYVLEWLEARRDV
jgi:pimeloyl-ACP methyl ester carboxylesterase